MNKPKNDDTFEYYVVEDKPKRKPKENYGTSSEQRTRLILVGVLLILAAVGAGLFLITPQAVFTNTVTFTSVSTTVSTPVSTTSSTNITTIIDGTMQAPQPAAVSDSVIDLAWSPDGNTLAVISTMGLRLHTGNAYVFSDSYEGQAAEIVYSPDGKTLAVASQIPGENYEKPFEVADITLFDTQSMQKRLILQGHSSYINRLVFNEDGSRLASSSQDKTVKLWDTTTGEELASLNTDLQYVTDIAFNGEDTLLVVGANDVLLESSFQHVIQKWDISARNQQTHRFMLYEDVAIYDIRLSHNGNLAAISTDNGLRIWDTTVPMSVATLPDYSQIAPISMTFSTDDSQLAVSYPAGPVGTGDGLVQIWSTKTGQMEFLLQHAVGLLQFSPDGSSLAIGTYKGVQIFDTKTGELLSELGL